MTCIINMFKSSFARELACDLRTSVSQDDSLSSYKSQFASEHQSFADNYQCSINSDLAIESHDLHDLHSLIVNSLEEFEGLGAQGAAIKTDPTNPQKNKKLSEKTTTDTIPGHFHTNVDSSTLQRLRQTCGELGLEYDSQQWDCIFNLLKDEKQNEGFLANTLDQDKISLDGDKDGDHLNEDEECNHCNEQLNGFVLPQTHKPMFLGSDHIDAEGWQNAASREDVDDNMHRKLWMGAQFQVDQWRDKTTGGENGVGQWRDQTTGGENGVGQWRDQTTGGECGTGQWRDLIGQCRVKPFHQHWTESNTIQKKEIEVIVENCDLLKEEAEEKCEGNVGLSVIEANFERLTLAQDNAKLKRELEEIQGGEKNYNELMKEVEQLQWQLNKMENSRKTYEAATKHLVTFLDQVSSALALSSPTKKTQFGSNILDRDTSKFNRKTPIRVKSRRSMRSGRVSGSIDSFPCMTPGSLTCLPPLMLVNKTPVCSSSPLQSLMEDQQCNMSATTEDAIRMSSPQSVHKLLQSSHKRCSPRSVSSAADCSPRHKEAWRAHTGSARRQTFGSPAWRHIGDCTSHSQAESMESGKDSGRASDTSSSGRSTPSKVCGRTSRRTETRHQLANRANRLVTSIRQLLAMENKGKRPKKGHLGNDAPFNTRLPGSQSPWILRPHNLAVHPVSEPCHLPPKARPFSVCGDRKSRVELVCPDTEYSVWRQGTNHRYFDHLVHPEQENGADESLSPRAKILRSQSEKLVIPKSIKPPKTSLRTCSFQQSTPKKSGTSVTLGTWQNEDTLIKINSMGVVSVPVPYPVHCHPAKSKGNILWV